MKNPILILFCVFLMSCGNKQPKHINHSSYFDISAFVQSQILLLDSTQPQLLKYSKWNEEVSTDTLTNVDWSKELTLFKDLKISPASWRTDYELIDSVVMDDQIIRAFGALHDNLEIRFVELVTNKDGQLKRFNVDLRSENKFIKNNRKMSFTVNKGFTIVGLRQTWLMDDESYKIVCQQLKQPR